MRVQFGPFRLDEPARALWLADHEIALQPRVFDLLVYLLRHRDRVVSKDELLDALWPGVTVTDNSLQRAISLLRGTLREGGLEDAVRNFPRSGYRLCLDFDLDPPKPREDGAPGAGELDAARNAVARRRWHEEVVQLEGMDGGGSLTPEDLDRWAFALQCLGKPSCAVPILVRAIRLHTEAGGRDAAAAAAVTLSTIHLERGDVALAKGWIAHARELVAARVDSATLGQVIWMESRLAAADGEAQRALDLADAAYAHGRRTGSTTVEALGLMYRGFFRLAMGDTRAGLADQDRAAAISLSGHVDPITGGVLYCNILWACRTFGDWARANQWTLGYQEFCASNGMGFSGSCQLHRAEVLGIRGSLKSALTHIEDALMRLDGDAPWALGDAHRVLGDILSALGEEGAAFSAYEKCYALGWNPEPGHALLLLERGETDAAYGSLERSLIGQTWWTLQRQGILLAHLALAAAHAGRRDRAVALIADLGGQEERWPMPSIRALVNEAAAFLAREDGKTDEALRHLHLARQLWTSIESRLHAARLRLEIADMQLSLGDRSGAMTELRAALSAGKEMESGQLLRKCRDVEQRFT